VRFGGGGAERDVHGTDVTPGGIRVGMHHAVVFSLLLLLLLKCGATNPWSGLQGAHSFENSLKYGDWSWNGLQGLLDLRVLVPMLAKQTPLLVPHAFICWKGSDDPRAKQRGSPWRYGRADPSVPGILARTSINPCGKPFRMIDGAHRMAKLTLESNITASLFYVLNGTQLPPLVQWDGAVQTPSPTLTEFLSLAAPDHGTPDAVQTAVSQHLITVRYSTLQHLRTTVGQTAVASPSSAQLTVVPGLFFGMLFVHRRCKCRRVL
jgi:hypothetical protein